MDWSAFPAINPFLAFALAALLIELTPGPNMTWLAIVAASEGRWRGIAAVAGVAVWFFFSTAR